MQNSLAPFCTDEFSTSRASSVSSGLNKKFNLGECQQNLHNNNDDCLTSLNWLVQSSSQNSLTPTLHLHNKSSAPKNFCKVYTNTVRCRNGEFKQKVCCKVGSNGSGGNGGGLKKQCTPWSTNTAQLKKEVDYKRMALKPPFSYAQLICLAMEAHGKKKVLLGDIYAWIRENFCYYKRGDTSWQNSIRHNLSLNKQFVKVPRDEHHKGKGSYWMLEENNKDPYCLRRRNFAGQQQRRCHRPEVDKPQVNPAVKNFLEKNRRKLESRRHPFSGTGERLEDIGAQECVVTDSEPIVDDFNRRLFKKDVELYDSTYEPNLDQISSLLPDISHLHESLAKEARHENKVCVEYLNNCWDNYVDLTHCATTQANSQAAANNGQSIVLYSNDEIGGNNLIENHVNTGICENNGENANLNLIRIPSPVPDWLLTGNGLSVNTGGLFAGNNCNFLMSPGGTNTNPLAKVFESLNNYSPNNVNLCNGFINGSGLISLGSSFNGGGGLSGSGAGTASNSLNCSFSNGTMLASNFPNSAIYGGGQVFHGKNMQILESTDCSHPWSDEKLRHEFLQDSDMLDLDFTKIAV